MVQGYTQQPRCKLLLGTAIVAMETQVRSGIFLCCRIHHTRVWLLLKLSKMDMRKVMDFVLYPMINILCYDIYYLFQTRAMVTWIAADFLSKSTTKIFQEKFSIHQIAPNNFVYHKLQNEIENVPKRKSRLKFSMSGKWRLEERKKQGKMKSRNLIQFQKLKQRQQNRSLWGTVPPLPTRELCKSTST